MVLRVPRPQAIHLKPAADLADRVLLPGDPHRALAVAQSLLSPPRMFNHHRGLWGYTGEASDGRPLTVQATGMGGPSAAVVVEELLDLGARTLVRIGTCGALDSQLELGDLLVATEALASDGTSLALGAAGSVLPDDRLTAALLEAAGVGPPARPAVVASTDLFYDDRDEAIAAWRERGAVAVEMEAAAVLRVAQRRGARAACVLAVSDMLGGGARRRIDREGIEAAGIRLGELAFAAVAAEDQKKADQAV
jgi:DeoD family purine-nucleoside phosphorylase